MATVSTQQIQPTLFQQIGHFIQQYWIYFLIIFVAIIIIVTIIILIKKIKIKINPFKEYYKKVRELCVFHKDPVIKTVWLIGENQLIFLGKYLGESTTYDGYFNIMLWKNKKWYLFWFPTRFDFFNIAKQIFIIRCNINKKYKYTEKNKDTDKDETKEVELAHGLHSRASDKILIKGIALERSDFFYYPVLRDKNGNIMNTSLEVFDREKNQALSTTLYNVSEDFVNIARNLTNLSPVIQYTKKVGRPPETEQGGGS